LFQRQHLLAAGMPGNHSNHLSSFSLSFIIPPTDRNIAHPVRKTFGLNRETQKQ
jgi:hypothetical protein